MEEQHKLAQYLKDELQKFKDDPNRIRCVHGTFGQEGVRYFQGLERLEEEMGNQYVTLKWEVDEPQRRELDRGYAQIQFQLGKLAYEMGGCARMWNGTENWPEALELKEKALAFFRNAVMVDPQEEYKTAFRTVAYHVAFEKRNRTRGYTPPVMLCDRTPKIPPPTGGRRY